MDPISALTLFALLVTLAALPSSSVALIVAYSATRSIAHGMAVALGIVIADICLLLLALGGFHQIAEFSDASFSFLRGLCGLYLLWLGFTLLRTPSTEVASPVDARQQHLLKSFLAGYLFTFGDVKALLFYASLLPAFIDLSAPKMGTIVLLIVITFIAVGGVKCGYAYCAGRVVVTKILQQYRKRLRWLVGTLILLVGISMCWQSVARLLA